MDARDEHAPTLRTSKRLHLKEPKPALFRPFEGKKPEGASRGTDTALKEMFEATGSLFNDNIPSTGMCYDFLQIYKVAIREKRKNDKENRIEFVKFVVEHRKRKNERRRFMERENRKIVESYLKEMSELL